LEDQEWNVSRDEASRPLPTGFVVTSTATLRTHVNASQVLGMGGKLLQRGSQPRAGKNGKAGRHKGHGAGELSRDYGNDERTPWLKVPSTRSFQISTIEMSQAVLLATSSTVAPVFNSVLFTIAGVADFSAFSAVFDQYRIRMIEVTIEPQLSEVTTPAGDPGEWISVVDIDDSNVPTSYADLTSYSSAIQTKGTHAHYHRWVPSVAVAVYSGAFTSFASTTSMWLDVASSTIQHYGLKVGFQQTALAQNYTLIQKLHVEWRARH